MISSGHMRVVAALRCASALLAVTRCLCLCPSVTLLDGLSCFSARRLPITYSTL